MFSFCKLSPTITDMIRLDHTHLLATFHQYSNDKSIDTKRALSNSICLALEIHAQLEEAIFYPALREVIPENETLLNSLPAHNELKNLISKLRECSPKDQKFEPILMELIRDTLHHAADEETYLLPLAEKLFSKARLQQLGVEMTSLRVKLVAPHSAEIALNTVKTFQQSSTFWVGTLIATTVIGLLLANSLNKKPQ